MTVLDLAIIAVPLAIVIAPLVSRLLARISRQADEVNHDRKAVRETHIRAIQARADKSRSAQSASYDAMQHTRGELLVRA